MAEELTIPADIIFSNILPRLPPKSLSRFKCVSKQWRSFLRTPRFRKMHYLHVINNNHQNNQKLLLLPNNRPWEFHTIDCDTPEDGISAARPLPFKVKPHRGLMSIVASLHGMVCVALTKPRNSFEYSNFILWNPFTGEHKTLSGAGSHNECYNKYRSQFGLYYSSSKDDYMLVCVTDNPNIVYIYSLKSDSWRKVESTGWNSNVKYVSYAHSVPSVLFNEKLYFLTYIEDPTPRTYSFITFDTQTEKLRDIATPPFENQWTRYKGFMVVRDCIHLCVAIRDSIGQHDVIEQWRMDGDGDWTKVGSSCLKEYFSGYDKLHHLMKNGNWLMYSRLEEGIYLIDAKKQTKGIICPIRIAFCPEGKYVENIVSPNQYLNFTEDLDQEDDVKDDLVHLDQEDDVVGDLKNMENRKKCRFKVPGFKLFVQVFKVLYSRLSNRSCRQITVFV